TLAVALVAFAYVAQYVFVPYVVPLCPVLFKPASCPHLVRGGNEKFITRVGQHVGAYVPAVEHTRHLGSYPSLHCHHGAPHAGERRLFGSQLRHTGTADLLRNIPVAEHCHLPAVTVLHPEVRLPYQ